jgi:serine/threonine protein kinase
MKENHGARSPAGDRANDRGSGKQNASPRRDVDYPAVNTPAPRPADLSNDNSNAKKRSESNISEDEAIIQLHATGEYEVVRELGRGGMGVVYEVRYLPFAGRREVVKVLSGQLVHNESARQRFFNEMGAIASLNHRGIATAYRPVLLPSHLAFAMEFVSGNDLHKVIRKHHPLPLKLACRIIRDVALALDHAHQRNLVHRDIKPSNIMLCNEEGKNVPKILDFGLSKAVSEQTTDGLTAAGSLLGTPEYLAPEQALDAASADIRADIYSLGCTFYHLLVGRPPFQGTLSQVAIAHQQQQPEPIAIHRPDVPAPVVEIVSKMIAKDKNRRFGEPRLVAAALDNLISGARSRGDSVSTPTNRQEPKQAMLDTNESMHLHSVVSADDSQSGNEANSDRPPNIQPATQIELPIGGPNQGDGRSSAAKTNQRRPAKSTLGWSLLGSAVVFALLTIGVSSLMQDSNDGIIVFKNIPPDAAVLVNGNLSDISDRNGDEASVRVEPGTKLIEVRSGEMVLTTKSVEVGQREKLSIEIPVQPATSTQSVTGMVTASSTGSEMNSMFAGITGQPWIPVFANGKLTPRITDSTQDRIPGFEIETGLLVATLKPEELLTTLEPLTDFRCRLSYQLSGDCAPSLHFRMAGADAESYIVTLNSPSINAPKHSSSPTGSSTVIAQLGNLVVEEEEWHEIVLEAMGTKFKLFFDGELGYEFDDVRFTSGLLGLQCSGSGEAVFKIREFEYQRLLVPVDTQWQPIFRDGELADQAIFYNEVDSCDFAIQNKLLVGLPRKGLNSLRSNRLKNFRMRFEYRDMGTGGGRLSLRFRFLAGGYVVPITTQLFHRPQFVANHRHVTGELLVDQAQIQISSIDWHVIEVVAIESRFDVFLDGEFQYRFIDSRYDDGVIGFQMANPGPQIRTLEYQVLPD